MPDNIGEMTVPMRTEYFQQSVEQFRESVEEMLRAAEELEAAGVHFDDPVSGDSASVNFSEVFDLEISIKITPRKNA